MTNGGIIALSALHFSKIDIVTNHHCGMRHAEKKLGEKGEEGEKVIVIYLMD